MDLAIQRFNSLERPKGLIISLDADTLINEDFFSRTVHFFEEYSANTCVGYFEHLRVFAGQPAPDPEAIMEYELYLRMVRLGLEWAGYPHAFHSLGSNFCVTAETYVKAGGMGIQKSGEDFYFLQKCIPLGRFFENADSCVYPAARASDRVLFGTGPFIRDFRTTYPDGFKKYSWEAFRSLSDYLGMVKRLSYTQSPESLVYSLEQADNEITQLLGWTQKIRSAQERAGDQASFTKWIWRELDGLQMVRYLNEHQKMVPPTPVKQTAGSISRQFGYTGCTQHSTLILQALRKFERNRGILRIS